MVAARRPGASGQAYQSGAMLAGDRKRVPPRSSGMCVPQFPAGAKRAILAGFSRKRPGKVVAAWQQPGSRPGNGCGGPTELPDATGPQGPQSRTRPERPPNERCRGVRAR